MSDDFPFEEATRRLVIAAWDLRVATEACRAHNLDTVARTIRPLVAELVTIGFVAAQESGYIDELDGKACIVLPLEK